MVVHASNPSYSECETGRCQVGGQPVQLSETLFQIFKNGWGSSSVVKLSWFQSPVLQKNQKRYYILPFLKPQKKLTGNLTLKEKQLLEILPITPPPLTIFTQNMAVCTHTDDVVQGHMDFYWYVLTWMVLPKVLFLTAEISNTEVVVMIMNFCWLF